jgi:hypothetical protein
MPAHALSLPPERTHAHMHIVTKVEPRGFLHAGKNDVQSNEAKMFETHSEA